MKHCIKVVPADAKTKPIRLRTVPFEADSNVCVHKGFNTMSPYGDSVSNILMVEGYMSISKKKNTLE